MIDWGKGEFSFSFTGWRAVALHLIGAWCLGSGAIMAYIIAKAAILALAAQQ